jgi:hypothetical protein
MWPTRPGGRFFFFGLAGLALGFMFFDDGFVVWQLSRQASAS